MIPAQSTVRPESAAPAPRGEADPATRGSLGLLLASALVWLLVSGVLSLVTMIQLRTPSFLAACPAFTYGRTQALQETAFIYGWAANAAFAVAVWILSRLGGAPLRGLGLQIVGTLFWNLGVTAGLVCIACGEATAVPFLQMPAYIHPLLLVAYAAIATPGVLAWTGRRSGGTFAAQWYAVAALFLFPWLYSAAQVMLLAAPVHGVAQAVVASWFAQNVLTLWLIPVALASAYYLVPRLTGRALPNYDYAPHGLWALLFFGSWTGARHLVGGPVPAWIPTLAIVCTCLVLFHYLIVALNLRGGLGGGSAVMRFVRFGLLAYLFSGLADALFSFQCFAEVVQFTYFPMAQLKLVLTGTFSFLIFAAIYDLGPRVTGVAWPSAGLIRAHFGVAVLGTLVTVVGLAAAGWVQGRGLLAPGTSFDAIAAGTRPWLLVATAGEALLLLGSLIITLHFFRLQAAACCAGCGAGAATLEASAS